MEGHHHHHHPHHLNPHQYGGGGGVSSVDTGGSSGGGGGGGGDRFPQWSIQETRDFLMIRAELDQTFMETKRNKLLWDIISTQMKEKGYNRSAEQCKCKWKNLVTRYKGCEAMEPEGLRQQFPFYNEMQAILSQRMQRMLWAEAEGGGPSGSKRKGAAHYSTDEEEDNEDSEGEKVGGGTATANKKKKKAKVASANPSSGGANTANNVREVLEDFMRQQMQMEMQWMKAYEAREEERRAKEMEWRHAMEAMENERLMMERRWREREEQRRVREEARAEKRDALITALLNKLRRDDM